METHNWIALALMLVIGLPLAVALWRDRSAARGYHLNWLFIAIGAFAAFLSVGLDRPAALVAVISIGILIVQLIYLVWSLALRR